MKFISKSWVLSAFLCCFSCVCTKIISSSFGRMNINDSNILSRQASDPQVNNQGNGNSVANSMQTSISDKSAASLSSYGTSNNPFILDSRSLSGKRNNGLMTSSGKFITCEPNSKVLSSKRWFLHSAELRINLISEDAIQETVTVNLISSSFGCFIEIVPFSDSATAPALKCETSTKNDNTQIIFKKFSEGYYILTASKKYISFEDEPLYTSDFMGSVLIYTPFKLPRIISTFGFINDAYCRNLDCDRVVFNFKACNSFLGMSPQSSKVPEYFIMQAFEDNYINLSIGSNYITITPSKSLTFDIEASTSFSLLKIIKLNDNELALMGYGGKYIECKDGLIYLSDGLSLNSKLVPMTLQTKK